MFLAGNKDMVQVKAIFKRWALLWSILTGMVVYLLFSKVPLLEPAGTLAGPFMQSLMPYCLFGILYVTFCKIEIKEFRPHTWHFILQGIRTLMAGLLVLWLVHITEPSEHLIVEGVFICVICPTAAAAAVISEKLGGSIASLTVYTIIANFVTSIIRPLFFPMVEPSAQVPFLTMSMLILRRVLTVLVLPLLLAFATRRWWPALAGRIKGCSNLGFYLWCFNLSIVSGVTLRNILCSTVHGGVMAAMLLLPLPVCLLQFAIGKAVGRHFGESITAGQALGQKNTVVGIWLTITFLNPLAAIAPGGYLVWQNIINAVQIWYKEKYGYLKW